MSVLQVRVQQDTIDKIDTFQKAVNSSSTSDCVRRAIDISALLVRAIDNGDRIIIESQDGKQKQLLISGLNK